MPKQNGAGPRGMGPGTGWGLGPCGVGMGWRRGYGRFMKKWGCVPFWSMSGKEEKEILKDEIKALEEELSDAKKRIAELGDK